MKYALIFTSSRLLEGVLQLTVEQLKRQCLVAREERELLTLLQNKKISLLLVDDHNFRLLAAKLTEGDLLDNKTTIVFYRKGSTVADLIAQYGIPTFEIPVPMNEIKLFIKTYIK
jgi:hypothetical protein